MVHLHLHTTYSLLDGIIKIPDLVSKVKNLGHKAVAISDHGSIGGVIEFYNECKKQEIKPIIGCEFYHQKGNDTHHLLLLARNRVGFDNLVKLNNLSYTNFYRKPRITDVMIEEFAEGLIGTSSCLAGYYPSTILKGEPDDMWYDWMVDVFGGHFYPEVQDNKLLDQEKVNRYLLGRYDNCVATADAHYLDEEDSMAHEVALGIMTNKKLDDPKAMKFDGEGYWIRSDSDFSLPESTLRMSEKIAETVEVYDIGSKTWVMPEMEIDPSKELMYLQICLDSYFFMKELSLEKQKEYEERLAYEFSVIEKNGFLSYFKMVADLCKDFDGKGMFRGWGRGSASGSLVSFLYGITKIDPIEWGLYFERFLNPDRITPPDIDLDFMPEHKELAIQFFRDNFGEVYQIGSYGTLGTKEVIKSCAKIMGVSTRLDSYVPVESPVPTVEELMKKDSFVREVKREGNERFIQICIKLESLKRSASTHASGIVISDGNIPIKVSKSGVHANVPNTAWDMYSLEDLRYVKFDILGVANLSMIDAICKEIDLRVEKIPLNDRKTFELIQKCETLGVFQWESEGFKSVIRKLRPDRFSELLDLNTLYRPGCLESGLTDQYIRRKHGEERVSPIHPLVVIEGQQGLPLYQEDIMKMVRDVAGFTLSEADTLRKAIGKKEKESFGAIQTKFIAGCQKKGVEEAIALDLWEKIEKFARYTWNKAHSVAYTLVSWWTAYLSAHHSAHFLCELLNKADDADRRRLVLGECRRRGVKVNYPDINESGVEFTVKIIDKKEVIFLGFQGIKYLGEKNIDILMEARKAGPFKDRENFIERTRLNKRALEYMGYSGCFGEEYKGTLTDEREALGYNIGKRQIDEIWYGKYIEGMGEVMDVHTIVTKKGDPMAFIQVEYQNETKSITVFPSHWARHKDDLVNGCIGVFVVDNRGVLELFYKPTDIKNFRVQIEKPEEFLSFCPSLVGRPNIYYESLTIASVEMTEEMLKFIETEFGLVKIF